MTLSGSRILHQLLAGCVRVIAHSEVSLKRSLLPNESEIRWEIPAPPVIHRSASLPHPDKSFSECGILVYCCLERGIVDAPSRYRDAGFCDHSRRRI